MGKAWKPPTEVESYLIPGGHADPDRVAFLADVLRRLEATTNGYALRYPFVDERALDLYRAYTLNTIKRQRGPDTIATTKRIEEGVPILYVRRGPRW